MSATLDSLSNEILEQIVQNLDLASIRSLRRVSRAISYKATQGTFRSFFHAKHVEISRPALDTFAQLTRKGCIGCSVKHLALVGIVHGIYGESAQWRHPGQGDENVEPIGTRPEGHDEQGVRMSLLNEALSNIATNNSHGLQSLSLEVGVYPTASPTRLTASEVKPQVWQSVFEAAQHTFFLVMSCLQYSKLRIRSLHIFSTKPVSLGCNLPCDALSHFDWKNTAFAPSFADVTTLSISISDPIIVDNLQTSDRLLRDQVKEQTNFTGLPKMLATISSNLKELSISGYGLVSRDSKLRELQLAKRRLHMRHLAHLKFPRLTKLRVAGLGVQDTDLVGFLQQDSLREVELNEISVTKGSCAPILESLAGKKLGLIHLEDLYEGEKLIHFAGERQRPTTQISGDHLGRNVIRCWGEDTKRLIECYPYRGMAVGSSRVTKWAKRRKCEYGARI